MLRSFIRLTAFALLLALVPGAQLGAQEESQTPPPVPQQPQMPDSVRELMTEFQRTQQVLDSIQTRAVESNPELATQQQELQQTVQDAMIEMHPDLEPKMERMEEIQGQIQQAQQNQNRQKVQELVTEVRGIRQELQSAQAEAMEQEHVSQAIDEFRDDLMAAMTEVDPQVEQKLSRLDELAERLRAIQMQGSGPGGGR